MDKIQEKHYEERFNMLLERGRSLHTSNKKRIRIGLFFLIIFTVAMIIIRFATDSDRATFLIIWVLGMFVISIYLVGIEYIDDSIEKTLEEVTNRESGWDDLFPDSESMRDRVQGRIDDRREERKDRISERRTVLHERYQSLRESLEGGKANAEAGEDAKTSADTPEQTDQIGKAAESADQPADSKEGGDIKAPESEDKE